MKILVLGGNGAVGQLAIGELLEARHDVTALVRNPSSMMLKDPHLDVIQGDPTNAVDMGAVLTGQDAVLSTLGARTNKRTRLRTDVAANLVMYEDAAMADALIEKGGCDSIIVRPMSFTNGEKTGNISVITDMSLTAKLRLRIARADVASFLVQQIFEDHYVGRHPIIFT